MTRAAIRALGPCALSCDAENLVVADRFERGLPRHCRGWIWVLTHQAGELGAYARAQLALDPVAKQHDRAIELPEFHRHVRGQLRRGLFPLRHANTLRATPPRRQAPAGVPGEMRFYEAAQRVVNPPRSPRFDRQSD